MKKRTVTYKVITETAEDPFVTETYCYTNTELKTKLCSGGFPGEVIGIKRFYKFGVVKDVTGSYFRQIIEHNKNRELASKVADVILSDYREAKRKEL